jgi:two-component system NtrC family sensor kinase
VTRVVYGGKIVNCYFGLIDKIHDIVYESKLYRSKPVGTVTIFQDDVRIATNVLTDEGKRAIGTRVSAQVYENVVKKGEPWIDRAFVVTDWYLTAYEPIRDVSGAIIGIFYVGILEQPFTDMIRSTLFGYLLILGIAAIFAGIVAFLLAAGVAQPLTRFVHATDNIAAGDLTHRVEIKPSINEIARLAESFNEMARKLHERELSLKRTNDQLGVLNSRYLDLVGMVTHELKGILSSVMLNACSVRDGYLGEVNEPQKKAMASVVRNLEYFDLTVKNFLNLSRIEKNELTLSRSAVAFKEDIVDESIDAFARQAQEKFMTINNLVPQGSVLQADPYLLLMVINNMIGNAIKYGDAGGSITIRMHSDHAIATVEVFNTGRGLTEAEVQRLFKRFSRLDNPEGRKVRGTGLGLFLCKETVEQHGGTMWCEPRENGNAFIFTIPNAISETVDREHAVKENDYA